MPRSRIACILILLFVIAWIYPTAPETVSAQAAQPDYRPGVVLVGYREQVAPRLLALPSGAELAESKRLAVLDVVEVQVPLGEEEAYRQKLLTDPSVAFAELDYEVWASLEPNDPRWAQQYGPVNVRAPQAWDVTTGAQDTIIAILDSGIDSGHPEFSGRLLAGYDFVQDDATPQDQCGHGTHVAGIVAANGDNGRGIAGIDWQARILPVRVLNNHCSGFISGVADGVLYAVEHGANVINMSLGASTPSTLLENATYYAYSQGVTLVAAAGNYGASLSYPARYDWILAVGAVDRFNNPANFSNPSTDPGKLMVAAPGVAVLSTTPRVGFTYEDALGWTREYSLGDGTSMASPHAAGAAGLLSSQPAFDTPDKIYQALTDTALDLETPGWDADTGFGLIQIDLALAFDDFDPPPPPPAVPVEYDQVNSLECDNIVYGWLDAQAGGAALPVFGTDGWAEVALPFTFDFAGVAYDRVYVSANGYLTFIRPPGITTPRENSFIPGIALPNNFIAPFWDDHNPSAGGQVYGMSLSDRYVVEWHGVPHQGYTPPESQATFEVVLFRGTNRILFQYHSLDGPFANGSSATIGLEYADGQAGEQYAYNQPGVLQEELAILFVPVTPGSTRVTAGCLFTTREDLRGCDQLPPFGVALFEDPQPLPPDPLELSIRLLRSFRPVPGGWLNLERFARIEVDNAPATLDPAAMVCYQYSAQDVLRAGGHPENMFLATYNGSWQRLPTVVNTQQQTLSAAVQHFSVFGVFARAPEALPVTGSGKPLLVWALAIGLLAACARGLRWLSAR